MNMEKKRCVGGWLSRSGLLSLLLLVAMAATSCRSPAPPRESLEARKVKADAEWPPAYTAAILDALNPEPSEVSTDLTEIVQSNPELIWMTIDGEPHVLVATLTGNTSYYSGSVGTHYDTGDYDIWVTASPLLHDLCSKPDFDRGGSLDMRLRQILGLTPTAKVTAFVEFWVKPESLFRPAPDNEITDDTAGLNLPENTESWYREWFNSLRSTQYFQSDDPAHDAYPWTQLGYTYDWGTPSNPKGLSEFVIRSNSDVVIKAIYPIDEYCSLGGS